MNTIAAFQNIMKNPYKLDQKHAENWRELQRLNEEIAGYNAELLALQAEYNLIAEKADKLLGSLREAQKKVVLIQQDYNDDTNTMH
jgi:uncharacterized coiled-coil DUF342 family protein